MSTRDIARRLHRLGYVVMPIGSNKVPLIKWARFEVIPPTCEELRAMPWERAVGVGLICGRPHGYVVADFDDEPSWAWALATLPVVRGTKTRRGGHLHFAHPPSGIIGNRSGRTALTLAEGVKCDVKGLGGYAMAPHSVHPSGFVYLPVGDWTAPLSGLPPLPECIRRAALDRPPAPAPPPPARRFGGDPVRAVEAYLRKIGGVPPEGCGSHLAVFGAAAWARTNVPELSADEFVAAVRQDRPEFTDEWVKKRFLSARGSR